MAQFWTANCAYETNENRHTQSLKYDYVGENMLALSGYSANYTLLVNRWYKIGQSYDFQTMYCRDEDGNQEQCEDEMDCICSPYVQVNNCMQDLYCIAEHFCMVPIFVHATCTRNFSNNIFKLHTRKYVLLEYFCTKI